MFVLAICQLGASVSLGFDASGRVSPDTLKEWHDVCLNGNAKAIDAQIQKFEKYLKSHANDYLAQVYLGGAYALRSRASFWGPSKLSFLKRAEKLMDSAVASDPDNPRVRMVNAIGSYRIPEKFKRRPVAVRDFKILVPITKGGSGVLNVRERQAVLYYASLTFSEEGMKGAAELRRLCHQLDPDSEYGKLAR